MTLDTANRILRQFHRGDFFRCKRRRAFSRRFETPLRFGHGALLVRFLVLPDYAG
jgi:hypothetical protein